MQGNLGVGPGGREWGDFCQDKSGHVCAIQALRCIGEHVCFSYLLRIIGHVWKHGGHVKHDLVVLIGGIQRVCSSRVRC